MAMHVTLINAPWYFQDRAEFLSQNLGIAYIASYLEKEGHRVTVVDALAEGLDRWTAVEAKYERVRRYGLSYDETVNRIPPDTGLIGISVPFSHNRTIYENLAAKVRERYPRVKLVGGGMHPSTSPDEALVAAVDAVVVGEGEIPMSELAAGRGVKDIPGAVYRGTDGTVVRNPPAPLIEDLDSTPPPARHLLPMDRYLHLSARGVEEARTAAMVTSRGCPFACGFCSVHPVYGRRYRPASAETVLREIVHLIETYDIQHIEFEDDNFTLDRRRTKEILDGLIEIRNTIRPITWEDPNGIRIDTMDRDLIRKAKASGCRCLFLALEHGDEEMRKIMNKQLKTETVERVVLDATAVGMPVLLFTMVGYPGETRERFLRGVRFCEHLRNLGAGRFEVFIAKPYPGTPLVDLCREEGYLRYPDVENLVFNLDTVAIETPDFDAAEIRRRQRYALNRLNPFVYRFKKPFLRVFPRRWLRKVKKAVGIQ